MKPLIVDTLASGKGVRHSTRDVIGAGPRTVAGVLESKGLNPDLLTVMDFIETDISTVYDILFISGMTSDLQAIQKVVRKWRRQIKGPVVIGGPAASEPERVLRRTGGDIAVTGEGEYAILELLRAGLFDGVVPEDLESIRGISYRRGKQIHVNSLRPVSSKMVFDEFPPSTDVITSYRLYKSARV